MSRWWKFERLPVATPVYGPMKPVLAGPPEAVAASASAASTTAVIATFIAMTEAVALATGFSLLFAFRQIHSHAVAFNLAEARPYGVWIMANLGEFLFATGVSQMVLFFAAPFADTLRREASWRGWFDRRVAVVGVGLLAVLIATDLAGINRGEVTRLWIFLACFFQIPAAYFCARSPGPGPIAIVVTLTTFHTATALAMVRFVVP